ncbi:MAG: hypothetical protein VYE77_00890 [Planctomycetota bacterium]|nr:hypothetical protein [Planctomycetota bacterium]
MTRIGSLTLAAVAISLAGCSITGPSSVATGRSAYNRIINKTEDEQILSLIVHERYDETYGLLAVSSVTSSIKTTVRAASELGFGPTSNYDGNLVPLTIGAAYEENPTISYVPLAGEAFLQRALEPMSLHDTYLMARASQDCTKMFQFMVRRLNGLANAIPGHMGPSPGFLRAGLAFETLHRQGSTELVRSEEDIYYIALLNYTGHEDDIREFLEAVSLQDVEVTGQPILLPLQMGLGKVPGHLVIETRSVIDLVRAIGDAIEIPAAHLESGVVEAIPPSRVAHSRFLNIRSSKRPPTNASVATKHRGYWFYISLDDTQSKRAFVLLRTLIGIRLSDPTIPSRAPALTIPVN